MQEKVAKFHKTKIRGALLRAKIPSFEENEPSVSFLHMLEKRKGEENTIYTLFDEDSQTLKTNTEEIKHTLHKFYSNLYKSDGVNEVYQQ